MFDKLWVFYLVIPIINLLTVGFCNLAQFDCAFFLKFLRWAWIFLLEFCGDKEIGILDIDGSGWLEVEFEGDFWWVFLACFLCALDHRKIRCSSASSSISSTTYTCQMFEKMPLWECFFLAWRNPYAPHLAFNRFCGRNFGFVEVFREGA